MSNCVKEVVMVVPLDAYKYEAKYIAEEYRNQRHERREVVAVRDLHL